MWQISEGFRSQRSLCSQTRSRAQRVSSTALECRSSQEQGVGVLVGVVLPAAAAAAAEAVGVVVVLDAVPAAGRHPEC